jgi:hypothetical protein
VGKLRQNGNKQVAELAKELVKKVRAGSRRVEHFGAALLRLECGAVGGRVLGGCLLAVEERRGTCTESGAGRKGRGERGLEDDWPEYVLPFYSPSVGRITLNGILHQRSRVKYVTSKRHQTYIRRPSVSRHTKDTVCFVIDARDGATDNINNRESCTDGYCRGDTSTARFFW